MPQLLFHLALSVTVWPYFFKDCKGNEKFLIIAQYIHAIILLFSKKVYFVLFHPIFRHFRVVIDYSLVGS
jgi:hypothetical protein